MQLARGVDNDLSTEALGKSNSSNLVALETFLLAVITAVSLCFHKQFKLQFENPQKFSWLYIFLLILLGLIVLAPSQVKDLQNALNAAPISIKEFAN